MLCPKCGTENPPTSKFCRNCGKEVGVRVCQACGAEVIEGARFCQNCGKEVGVRVCQACGAELPKGARFCRNCGKEVILLPPPPPPPPPSRSKQKQYPEPRRHAIMKGKEKARLRRLTVVSNVLGVVIGVVIFMGAIYFLSGHSLEDLKNLWKETPVQSVISRDDAVGLATNRVQEDGVMSLADRKTAVKEEPNQWHITFPLTATMVRGGEPHVIIDKASGAIIDVYYTQ